MLIKKEKDFYLKMLKKNIKNRFIEYLNKINIYKNLLLLPLTKYKVKKNKDYIVLSATFELKKGNIEEI